MATGRVPTTANSPLTAKGDLFTYDTSQARLAVGNNGETLVADSSTSTGLRWQGNFAAGKNKIINGDFGIWQRGTSFSTVATYTADRWYMIWDGTGATRTISKQTFTPGTAPVAGYEGKFFIRYNQSVAGSGGTYSVLTQRIEDVQTFAGQTVTLSFWAKSAGTTAFSATLDQNFGSGGSAGVETGIFSTTATTTGWVRYSATVAVPSISGKTIGSGSFLAVTLILPINTTFTLDIWGVQLEAGNTATAFQTATGTLAGEYAACCRYYERVTADASYGFFGNGYAYSTSAGYVVIPFKTLKRTTPTVMDTSAASTFQFDDGTTGYTPTALAISAPLTNTSYGALQATGATGMTQYRPALFVAKNSTTAYIGFSAEL